MDISRIRREGKLSEHDVVLMSAKHVRVTRWLLLIVLNERDDGPLKDRKKEICIFNINLFVLCFNQEIATLHRHVIHVISHVCILTKHPQFA